MSMHNSKTTCPSSPLDYILFGDKDFYLLYSPRAQEITGKERGGVG